MIDTHCHLTFDDFAGRIPEIMDEARSRSVTGAITISTNSLDCLRCLEVAEQHERVWCSSGVHPLYSHEFDPSLEGEDHNWANLRRVAEHAKCLAWGELGLDYHYDGPHRATQDAVLEKQLAFIEGCAGDGLDLPVVIHCREAFDELIPVLRASSIPGERFVFHCFTAGPREAKMAIEMGASISFTGVVTYKNAAEVRDASAMVPSDRIMVETDAPFLSPEPHRGTRPCRPAFTRDTAERLAEVRGVGFDAFHEQINANTTAFFGITDP